MFMRNLLLTISFDGSAYHGWQVQENAVTVQQTLQDAWEKVCRSRDNVIGCSRTDAGVHANMYCCNFRTENEISCDKLIQALNANLPDDIAVSDCREVPYEFHARYDCKSKEYIYKIWNKPEKNPFLYKYSLHYKYPLDEKFLDSQAKQFIGKYDYSAFCAAGSSVEDTVRNVTDAEVTRDGDIVIFRVRADGFLYNMVRIMTGTLIEISAGKIMPDTIKEIIVSVDRSRAGATARPEGLFLNKIFY
jgi:tRNA pseudouridine38-40 synthase